MLTPETAERIRELIGRKIQMDGRLLAAHCAEHAALPILERPVLCPRCRLDLEARLRMASESLRWATEWQADAIRILADLEREDGTWTSPKP